MSEINHIAIIMDGNRRWASVHGLPSAAGHKKGVDALRRTVRACSDRNIKYLTVYAFSTENWKRSKDEVDFLMNLIAITLKNELDEMHKEGVKIRFIGDLSQLNKPLQQVCFNAQEKTKNNTGVNLQIALNYGAQDEIVHAMRKISTLGLKPEEIDAVTIENNLYTAGISAPDLLIRTGGEKRISNFLLWQIAYSEIVVIDEFWPEFDENLLDECIKEFNKRQRRYGE